MEWLVLLLLILPLVNLWLGHLEKPAPGRQVLPREPVSQVPSQAQAD
ncbi:hypothetical protein [Deinococcus misasensis]|nr:hypothetical protein [Deinococcus misasensis]